MILRPYRPEDLPALQRLYYETIHTVNRADYTQEQLNAWAPTQPDMARWQKKLAEQEVIVAESDHEIVGFCSWDATGYLDFLYVHHAHQRKGIASALYERAERSLKAKSQGRIHTQASTTAQPFFTQQGFRVVKQQTVSMRGVKLANTIMEKPLE
jgi:putative acetyltransferase